MDVRLAVNESLPRRKALSQGVNPVLLPRLARSGALVVACFALRRNAYLAARLVHLTELAELADGRPSQVSERLLARARRVTPPPSAAALPR